MPSREDNPLRPYGKEIGEAVDRIIGYRRSNVRSIDESLQVFLETAERRRIIAEKIQQERVKLNLADNRLQLPEKERPPVSEVLQYHLLGIVDDNVLITDLLPNATVKNGLVKAPDDLLWKPVFTQLTPAEGTSLTNTLRAIRRFYYDLGIDIIHGQSKVNFLMRDSIKPGELATFETVADLRKLNEIKWDSIPAIGRKPAKIMTEAVKRIT